MWRRLERSSRTRRQTGLVRRRAESFDEVVKEGLAFVERLDEDALVAAMEADVVAIDENALYTVGRNASDAKRPAIGGFHHHVRNDGDAGPKFRTNAASGVEHVGTERRGWAAFRFAQHLHRDLVVGDHLAQRRPHILRRV